MEFKPEDIAKLVLGYLRENKCQTAFCEFLTSSQYLKEHVTNQRRGKYIVTRVNGLSLVDYLAEYAFVYSIVQEHIEASDYYNERGLRTSLAQQLLYLLSSRSAIQSRTSTPIQNDIISCAHREDNSNKSKSTKQSQNIPETIINNSFDIINDEISATPIQSLPGNCSTELSFLNSSKNKSVSSLPNVNRSTDTEADVDHREKSQEMCREIFTQTFLENTELIDKLADNINKEVSSNFHIGQELYNNAIETIIQRIAKDPIVVNSIEEIIATGEEETENHTSPDEYTTLNAQDNAKFDTSKERALLSTPKKNQSPLPSSMSIKSRLRTSTKKSCLNSADNLPSIEDQNNEVIQSIVVASMSGEKLSLDQESNTNNTGAITQTTPVGEVIFSEQPYNNLTQTLAGPSNQNQIYVNTVNSGSLLMVQPSVSSTCSNIVSAKNLQVDPTKPYYVIGTQQFGNVIIPQTPFKVSNVMTEQEIMAMPTIIVCDNNQQFTSSQTTIVSTPAPSISTPQNLPRTIAPRRTVEKAQSLSEYISLYQCNDPSSPIISQLQPEASPLTAKSKLKATTNRGKRKTDKKTAQGSVIKTCNILTRSETCAAENYNLLNDKVQDIIENITGEATTSKTEPDSSYRKPPQELEQSSSRNKASGESMPQIVTPKMTILQDVKERRSRSTPRNGSHVRQLDFSTPDKWCPKVRRANTSPKGARTLDNRETPVKAPKSGTSRSIRTSLFKSPELEVPVEVPDLSTANSDKENEQNKVDLGSNAVIEPTETTISQTVKNAKSCNLSWDADLRALAAPTTVEESVIQKQKRKRSEEFLKERNNSKKPKENLNKTEEDASKIEMALGGSETQIEIVETNVTKLAQEDVKNVKTVSTRRNRVSTKKASANKIIKTDNENQVLTKTTKVDRNLVDNNCATMKINNAEDVTPKLENQQKVINEETPPEKQYAVINRHVKSRIKKKCNMENSVKKTQMADEIILTNITKIKSCEILDESKNKLILSPSKLNANKRSLVEIENRSPVEISVAAKVTSDDTGTKFVTPELVKSSTTIPPVTAKRNIMPILETPVKFESIIFPKTPSICSPCTIDTPFTKAVLDQLTGVDINTIPTPKFPITPNVPFTPAIGSEPSPFSNRATDYSTSSSYYQPSDTEQNKSLEQLIEECRQLDSQTVISSNKVDHIDGTSTCKHSQMPEISGTTNKTEINELLNASNSPEVTNTSVTDKMKAFNHSMIGKKNLQLVKMFSSEAEDDESSSSSSSSTGTSTTSSSDDSDSSDSDGGVKTTPIKTVTPPYSLRSRKLATNNISANVDVSKETEKFQKASLNKEQHSGKTRGKSLSFQDGLLQEMEEKRQRTIARFKTASSATKRKDSSKQKQLTPKTKDGGRRIAKKDDSDKFLKKSTSKKVNSDKTKDKKSPLPKDNSNACVVNKNSNSEPNNQPDPPKELKLSETSSQRNESVTILRQVHQLNPTRTSFVSTKNAQATINDDKEIILHLSSDDENLEPSKLVEAVLLECSTSSTSVAGENLVSSVQCATSAFDNALDVKSAVNEQEGQGALDQEAETWVKLKGLMQMGIHLIPNKSTKKFVMPPAETEQPKMHIKENISGKSDQPATSAIEEMPSHSQTKNSPPSKLIEGKLEKSAVHKYKVKNAEKAGASTETTKNLEKSATSKEKPKNAEKPSTAKQKPKNLEKAGVSKPKCVNKLNKLNRSVEEGELVSDDDKSTKRENKLKIYKPDITKRVKPKTTSNSFRNDTAKEYLSRQNRLRDFREFYRYRPHSETQSKEPVSASTSKKLSSSKSFKLENKIPDKNTKPPNKAPEKVTEIKPKNESTTITEKQTVVNELDYQLQFDSKTYTEETYRVTHDYSKEINRTMSEYNLDILTKKFSANVYIAEIDSEVEKFLTFTPFQFLLDITPKALAEKKGGVSTKTYKSHVPKDQFKNKKKPLNILYNQLVKAAIETPRPSLLEDLYAPEASSRDYKRSSEMSRQKVIDRSRKSEKSEKTSRSKQKSFKEKSSDEEQSHNKGLENTAKYKNRRKQGEEELTSSTNKSDINPEDNALSINRETLESTSGDSIVNNDQGTKHIPQGLEQDLEVVDGVIMLNASKEEQKKVEIETSFETNDDLMNYALVGSDRVEDNDDLVVMENRKRKVGEEEGENQQEKKQKTEELLRNIDVDSFLKKLHGEM